MRPNLHATLVNGRTGDPALLVDFRFASRAILVDIGDIAAVPARTLLRVGHVLVSHCHIDHFIGFDRLLRLNVGRGKTIGLFGPERLIERVGHRLAGYTWNLVDSFKADLVFEAVEIHADGTRRGARFRLRRGFAPEPFDPPPAPPGVLLDEPQLHVRAAVLDHGTASIGYRLQEPLHVNVWRNRVEAAGLAVGPWLAALKRAVAEDAPDDLPVATGDGRTRPLGALRGLVSAERGQAIGYVTDIGGTEANIAAAASLVEGADLLFVEAPFAAADTALARERGHLTTADAAAIARRAGVAAVEPFHFSPRYEREEGRLLAEVREAFSRRDDRR